ncbi:protein spire homolog 1 isoform X4 [Danio rerio]|uniref:Protein spire homolog 1 isoform X4 n=1 Tax=Danio rerio TaxID=7955 RepID=A0A8M2B6B0_DANRE|nr:protein spire homolog 1 isoform X4 [Danio rerio]|eukprot:XP_005159678.1 protein spire homolog 1 isoform X4 [Danio rerio]
MTDGGMLISPSALQDPGDGARPEDIAMDCTDGEEELCLEEILTLYSQPINEEQAWAVCYQCCRWLTQKHRRKETGVSPPGRIAGPGDVRIRKDGNVKLYQPSNPDKHTPPSSSIEIIESLGIMIYKALDYGLKEHEERELSPPLEQLIDLMTNMADTETDCPDEGYEATEEEDEGEEENAEVSNVRGYRDIISLCLSHLPSPSDAPNHYQAVCRALYAETKELRTFLEKIKSAKENLRKMEGETEEPVRDLNELQNADWARFWVQVMRDLRHGVKLKKVQERQYNPLAIEYQLTPYEMLMDDIRSKRYKLRKVMVNGDIPPRLKKSAHEIILEFIRSRPPLNPVSARKLKPHAPQPPTLHERILEEIRSERKLRPVSPDMIRRSRLGAGKSISTPQDLFRSSDIPDGPRKLAISTLSLANGTSPARSPVNGVAGGHSLSQRKRLLKAPTLAELDSSDSEEEQSTRKSDSSSSISTSLVEDTSPESVMGKKPPPQFLPISSTPQPDKRIAPQRRHSIEKEAPTNIRHFLPPSRQNSKSLMSSDGKAHALGSGHAEEFCFPVECLTLTVEEVMHIRQVLVKAELEKFQQYKDIYNALKKGKLCFSCRSKKFSLFTWSYTCQFCKRPVCSQCCKKMKLPSKPHASLPISSLGPSILPKKEPGASSAPTDKTSSTSSHKKNSLQRSLSRSSKHGDRSSSKDELELPEQFTEDWSTMEVCVDCKKFINDIISNSRRNLSTKRARLHRRTHSVYSSSTSSSNYKPTERTIKEV